MMINHNSKFEDIPGIQTNRYSMRQIKQWDRYLQLQCCGAIRGFLFVVDRVKGRLACRGICLKMSLSTVKCLKYLKHMGAVQKPQKGF